MINIPDTSGGTSVIRLTPARCNIWAVTRNNRTIVVDTGISFDRSRIEHALERRGLVPEAVILTHTHFDHAGNAAWLQAEYGAEVVVQEAESHFLAGGDTPIPEGTYTVTRGLVSIGRKIGPAFRYDPCRADHVFADRFDLNRFGINGYIIHTPGHSPGGATAVIDDEIAIAGDSIIGTTPGKPFPPFADDVEILIGSWKKIIDTGCVTFLPGHGKPVSREEIISEYNKRK
ncbi:MAG: MBL fold metallo-hydrolase [Bacteroidales bacterium]|jgi:glyoxylase-like metal-dependent hydrolase (beta-lactamase superfamily II)|nr:MBL fold metallo-hydrolase [Bacteroidales bacterium]MDD3735613.1 MBL fold metallo-hydrolase [Bacteroidales bacterium]NLD62683.1 MBL fold metallo-hydrolase [Bacteroidales bacterium]HNT92541.1 MBL fold metallo-hydrolase [Bacteroidales bacterium]HOO66805.1 MBL fold metallo-hydrolase [Bacteroidales bacterium]